MCNAIILESAIFLLGETKSFDTHFQMSKDRVDEFEVGYDLVLLNKDYSIEDLKDLYDLNDRGKVSLKDGFVMDDFTLLGEVIQIRI